MLLTYDFNHAFTITQKVHDICEWSGKISYAEYPPFLIVSTNVLVK